MTAEAVLQALGTIRAPIQTDEYDLHALVAQALFAAGLPCAHEVSLGPRCRIDFTCGSVGIEVKRGKPERARLLAQLQRYAACTQLSALVLVSERAVSLPRQLGGKPLHALCLNRLWGISLG